MSTQQRSSGVGALQALVTGASSGIGEAVALRLLAAGYEVFGVSRRGGPKVADTQSGHAMTSVEIDLSDLEALPAAMESLAKQLPRLAVVVLAAGRGIFGSLEQQSYREISSLIDLNLTANVMVCRALMPVLKRLGRGKVIFIGSEAALKGKRQGSVYCATKFAVRGFAQALRDECASSGVAVSVIQPGMVRTPFFDDLAFEPGPSEENALDSEQVADAVEYILASPSHAVVDEIELSPLKHVVRKKRSS